MSAGEDLDVLWLIVAASLVFTMQAGFACLESGLVRAKNSINVVIKNLVDFLIAGFGFWIAGFAIMFGSTWGGMVGTSDFLFAGGPAWITAFFVFQLMFCGTTTTIVSGAVAERMRFPGYFAVAAVVSLLIYPVIGHWAWGGIESGTAVGWLARSGFVDFAGSTVVHSVGGWLSLAAVLIIGPRRGRFTPESKPIEGHNLPLAVLGVFILWFGWFGFNAGSTLRLTGEIAGIVLNTLLSPVAGGLVALTVSWVRHSKPRVEYPMNGVLAGLVGITAPCHVVDPTGAVLVGAVSGLILAAGVELLDRLRIDDAVAAVPVHLFAGIWGTLAVALVGDPAAWGTGLGRSEQFIVQLTGVAAVGAYAFGAGLLILYLLNRVIPLRASPQDEQVGLNVAEHGANTALLRLLTEMDRQRHDGDFSRPVEIDPETEAGQIAVFYNRVLDRVRDETRKREKAVVDMRRARDAAEQANRSKSHFLASISHELRTPLNAIIGFSELMNQEIFGPVDNARYREYLQDILDSGHHLLTLINDLLDLSKIEAHKYELHEQVVDLEGVVRNTARLVQKAVMDKRLRFDVTIGPDLPPMRCDERVFRQIALNLLSNAVKFTPTGGQVELVLELEPDGRMALIVKDTGVGIPKKDFERVLEPFSQSDSATIAADQPGTGLGLPLTRALARLHGGTMVLRSEPNVGTTVTVRFPHGRVLHKALDVA
ncbi:MAG TPA: ammonium transporter [Arenibaculum sp.]|nr:ammonium transporter [Arenibaculum sp.]